MCAVPPSQKLFCSFSIGCTVSCASRPLFQILPIPATAPALHCVSRGSCCLAVFILYHRNIQRCLLLNQIIGQSRLILSTLSDRLSTSSGLRLNLEPSACQPRTQLLSYDPSPRASAGHAASQLVIIMIIY